MDSGNVYRLKKTNAETGKDGGRDDCPSVNVFVLGI